MSTYIKTGFWEKIKQAPKEWLNLELFVKKIIEETPSNGVQSVTGANVDNTDPNNPVINAPYKVYTALLWQSGTDAPDVTTELENIIGEVDFTTYDGVGTYSLTFVDDIIGTVWGFGYSTGDDNTFYVPFWVERLGTNILGLKAGNNENGHVFIRLEIRVYN